MLRSYKELTVWKKAMQVVKGIYMLTEKFPKEELYGLVSQMRRAAVAIPSNIAEGYLRNHVKEYVQFLGVAIGSAAELETQLIICKSLPKFRNFDYAESEQQLSEIMKMLYVMIERLRERGKSM